VPDDLWSGLPLDEEVIQAKGMVYVPVGVDGGMDRSHRTLTKQLRHPGRKVAQPHIY
jgi:hypothetical protein